MQKFEVECTVQKPHLASQGDTQIRRLAKLRARGPPPLGHVIPAVAPISVVFLNTSGRNQAFCFLE